MLQKAGKLVAKIAGVIRVCGPVVGLRFCGAVLAHLPVVLRKGRLDAADHAMRGTFRVRLRGREIVVPVSEVDAANTIDNDAPTFAGIREIYADAVYLRGFAELGDVRTFVDLGANRGLVSLQAAAVLGAETVIGVEAQAPYSACFDVLAAANGLAAAQRHRVVAFAAGQDGDGQISVAGLMARFDIDRIDFLKCDIEGGENAVMLEGDAAFLNAVRLIAMELHPSKGTRTAEILNVLHRAGFAAALTDLDGMPTEVARADYLFASRDASDLALAAVVQ